MIPTPDFECYPMQPQVVRAETGERWVQVWWSDGADARFHHEWLRDNCPCPSCVHEGTKEQIFELVESPVGNRAADAAARADGGLDVVWSADGHASAYHPGWLRAHRYDEDSAESNGFARTVWDAATPGLPPTFGGPAVLRDDDALLDWLCALRTFGVTRLRDVPPDTDAVRRVAARVGIVRETNFGVVFDVKSEPEPISNANTGLSLPPHVDLATREYQPGLQFLHCLENSTVDGAGRFVDGFRLAAVLREEHPGAFATLTTVPWRWANRSRASDYRWASTPIVLDGHGEVVEVRIGNWLRAPLHAAFEVVEEAYAAYRTLFAVSYRDDLAIRVAYEPGDLMAFDNRRILHGRDAYASAGGQRFLRGCYGEREEMESRIRILERRRRERGDDR